MFWLVLATAICFPMQAIQEVSEIASRVAVPHNPTGPMRSHSISMTRNNLFHTINHAKFSRPPLSGINLGLVSEHPSQAMPSNAKKSSLRPLLSSRAMPKSPIGMTTENILGLSPKADEVASAHSLTDGAKNIRSYQLPNIEEFLPESPVAVPDSIQREFPFQQARVASEALTPLGHTSFVDTSAIAPSVPVSAHIVDIPPAPLALVEEKIPLQVKESIRESPKDANSPMKEVKPQIEASLKEASAASSEQVIVNPDIFPPPKLVKVDSSIGKDVANDLSAHSDLSSKTSGILAKSLPEELQPHPQAAIEEASSHSSPEQAVVDSAILLPKPVAAGSKVDSGKAHIEVASDGVMSHPLADEDLSSASSGSLVNSVGEDVQPHPQAALEGTSSHSSPEQTVVDSAIVLPKPVTSVMKADSGKAPIEKNVATDGVMSHPLADEDLSSASSRSLVNSVGEDLQPHPQAALEGASSHSSPEQAVVDSAIVHPKPVTSVMKADSGKAHIEVTSDVVKSHPLDEDLPDSPRSPSGSSGPPFNVNNGEGSGSSSSGSSSSGNGGNPSGGGGGGIPPRDPPPGANIKPDSNDPPPPPNSKSHPLEGIEEEETKPDVRKPGFWAWLRDRTERFLKLNQYHPVYVNRNKDKPPATTPFAPKSADPVPKHSFGTLALASSGVGVLAGGGYKLSEIQSEKVKQKS